MRGPRERPTATVRSARRFARHTSGTSGGGRTRREIILLTAGAGRGGPDAGAGAGAREIRRASAGRVGLHLLGFRAEAARYDLVRDAGGQVTFIADATALRAALERIFPTTALERARRPRRAAASAGLPATS